MKTYLISIAFIALFFLPACQKESNTDFAAQAVCTGAVPTYTAYIATILNNNCASSGCHNASTAKAGIRLNDYTNASSQFLSNSKNLASVHHAGGVDAMPRNAAKLSDALINKLDCWVKNNCPQ